MNLPIFWCERTGKISFERGFGCKGKKCKTVTWKPARSDKWPRARYPHIRCPGCGKDVRMDRLRSRIEMQRTDTGEIYADVHDLPPGAVWSFTGYSIDDLDRPPNWRQSPRPNGRSYIVHRPGRDKRVLVVKLPNGREWIIDSRASNCTLPTDDKHWCWCRHGEPEDGTLHVDKVGTTCAAGAGSIQAGDYHGFLHNGQLTPT